LSDTANPTDLAVQDAPETIAVTEIVQAARGLGIQLLPEADRMVTGRVWPGGQGWVGEIGEGSNIRALDDMYESMPDAIKAVDTEIRRLRDTAVNVLRGGGEQAASLAVIREHWQRPVLKVFADVSQEKPWLLQLPA
jgi:hypothetical protein